MKFWNNKRQPVWNTVCSVSYWDTDKTQLVSLNLKAFKFNWMNQEAAEEKQKVLKPKSTVNNICYWNSSVLSSTSTTPKISKVVIWLLGSSKIFVGELKSFILAYSFPPHIRALMHKLSWNWNLDMEPNSGPPGLRSVPGSRLDGNSVRSERRREK